MAKMTRTAAVVSVRRGICLPIRARAARAAGELCVRYACAACRLLRTGEILYRIQSGYR
jgi:hypothetical protein